MQKVKGYPGFIKDDQTGVVQNTNGSELQKARAVKRKILDSAKRNDELEDRVKRLESALELLLKENQNG